MPVARTTQSTVLWCALLLPVLFGGCRGTPPECAVGTIVADPQEIPEGLSETDLLVEVNNPSINDDFVVVTELTTISGTIADPFAQETTFRCAHDVSGPVEARHMCVAGQAESSSASMRRTVHA